MTIQTGITTNRKALATRISERLLDAPVTYAGVPSCAYKVGAAVTIDRQGCIEVSGDDALSILKPFFIEQGWREAEPVAEPTAELDEASVTITPDEPNAESVNITPDEPDEDRETVTPDEQSAEETETTPPDEPDAPAA